MKRKIETIVEVILILTLMEFLIHTPTHAQELDPGITVQEIVDNGDNLLVYGPAPVPQLTDGFYTLSGYVDMGAALEDAHLTDQGDIEQLTSRGLAYWLPDQNQSSFFDGWIHYALTGDGFVTWQGDDPAAPALIQDVVVVDYYDPLDVAYAQLGKPYIYGSAGGRSDFTPWARGFDCSGFVSYVMRLGYGIYLPASTSASYPWTYAIRYEDAQPGDIVYYNMSNPNPRIQHMAVYIGDGQIIQSGGVHNYVNIASAWQPVGSAPVFRRVR